MHAHSTRFSLLVSNYNYEAYLQECLDSIGCQEYDPDRFEIVCVDDGSSDDSWSIIEAFRRTHPNVVAHRIENAGLEKACNLAARAARYPRIMRVDADDRIAPNLLATMDLAIRGTPACDFYYCKEYVEYYSDSEQYRKQLPAFDVSEVFARGDFFATGTVYSKADLEGVGFFPESVKNCGLENYAVVLELVRQGKKGLAVPGASFSYRRHHANMSTVKREAIVEYGKKLLRRFGREFQTNQYHPYGLKLLERPRRP